MSHAILGRRILIITAHPDDEAFLCAATAWKNHQAGGITSIICATLGEKGMSHLKKPMTAQQLKVVRGRELRRCARLAHIQPVNIVGLPDGGVYPKRKKLLAAVTTAIKQYQPEILLSFGSDGWTGHWDHIACWEVSRQLAKKHKLPLYIFTVPPKVKKLAAKWFVAGRVNPHYSSKPLKHAKATVRVPLPAGLKMKILRTHKSQINGRQPYSNKYPGYAVKEFTQAEYFARR